MQEPRLFNLLTNYVHLGSQNSSGPAGELMTVLLADMEEYEKRLLTLKESLSKEFSESAMEMNASVTTLQNLLQLEERRAEEETIRMRAHSLQEGNVQTAMDVRPNNESEEDRPATESQASRLTDFWKMKYTELQREIEVMGIKREATLAKLEDIRSSQSSTAAKTTRAIASLNEKVVEHKRLAEYFMKKIHNMHETARGCTGHEDAVSPIQTDVPTPWAKTLAKVEEEATQRILQTASSEGQAVHRLASFLTKRENALKFRVQKLQLKTSNSSTMEAAALDDVLYLRAEVRGLREQLSNEQLNVVEECTETASGKAQQSTNQTTLVELRRQLDEVQCKIREARVATIRAEHKSRDGSMIVKRAVDEQRTRSLRERLAFVEEEKLKELRLSHDASLRAHYDATWLARSS